MSMDGVSWTGKREGGKPAPPDLLRLRSEMDARGQDVPGTICVAPAPILPGTSEWVRPSRGAAPQSAVLYLHGSGFSKGSPASHRPLVARIVAETGIAALVLDYRLAPEHRFPAALEDALAAYSFLLEEYAPESLAVIGDSAGGGLSLSLLIAARDRGLPMPACAVTLSAWTDLAVTGDPRPDVGDTVVTPEKLRDAALLYLDGADPLQPYASPLFGDLAGLPPLLMQVGGQEIMQEDTARLAVRCRAAGVPVEVRVYPGMPHVFPLRLPDAEPSLAAIAEIGAFVADHVSPRP